MTKVKFKPAGISFFGALFNDKEMGLKELVVILDEILKTEEGLEKRGHNWLYGNEEITKMVQLQKSNF